MVRVAILLISVLMSSLMSAENTGQIIRVNQYAEDENNYILYVKDIAQLNEIPLYGEKMPDGSGKYFGGDVKEFFEKNYKRVNGEALSKGVMLDRDNNGIFFKIPKKLDVDSIEIAVVKAIDKGGKAGWCPDTTLRLSINWILRTPSPANEKQAEVEAGDLGGENGTDVTDNGTKTPGAWEISNIDWILIALFIILALMVLMGKNKQPEAPKDNAEEEEKLKRYIDTLQAQINELKASSVHARNDINSLDQRLTLLAADFQKQQLEQTRARKVNEEKKQAFNPIGNTEPKDLGYAQAVSGEKALVIDNSGAGLFKLTRSVGGEVRFTLADNPEVVNFFETNVSMLDIFRKAGIISYDNIPANSHVRVKTEGVAMDGSNGTFTVVNPMVLSFD